MIHGYAAVIYGLISIRVDSEFVEGVSGRNFLLNTENLKRVMKSV